MQLKTTAIKKIRKVKSSLKLKIVILFSRNPSIASCLEARVWVCSIYGNQLFSCVRSHAYNGRHAVAGDREGSDEFSGSSEGKVTSNGGNQGALPIGELGWGRESNPGRGTRKRRTVSGGQSTGWAKARNGKRIFSGGDFEASLLGVFLGVSMLTQGGVNFIL